MNISLYRCQNLHFYSSCHIYQVQIFLFSILEQCQFKLAILQEKKKTETKRTRCLDIQYFSVVMPYLVREKLFIGPIGDAADILQNGSAEITHILSVLSSASISFFSEWRSSLKIPTKEIKKVYVGDGHGAAPDDDLDDISKSPLSPENLLYSLEYAGKDLKFVRMAVPLRDTENEDLLDYLDVCLNFIDRSRKDGSVLVHCFAGVSRRYHLYYISIFH